LTIDHRSSTNPERIVTPVKTGVQNSLVFLDSGFRRNDFVFRLSLLTAYSLLHTGSIVRLPTISPIFRIPFSTQ